jgi:dTDP-4-dehydrorhamnose reductase
MSKLSPTILVTGRDGQLGRALALTLSPLGQLTTWGRKEADFTKPAELTDKLEALQPHFIVNAAAWTKVDLAESQPDAALLVNTKSPALLADWAAKNNSFLIHYSTDYVFDGTKPSPYTESDSPNPINAYGQTKLTGDQAILDSGVKGLIFRTSWVFSLFGVNFPKTILKLAAVQPSLTINDDQIGAPTSAEFLAAATAAIIRDILSGATPPLGLYNLTCAGQTSWLGYATYLLSKARSLGFSFPTTLTSLQPSYGLDPSRPAKRPLNSLLDNSRLETLLNIHRPTWQEEIDKLLRSLASSRP